MHASGYKYAYILPLLPYFAGVTWTAGDTVPTSLYFYSKYSRNRAVFDCFRREYTHFEHRLLF